MKSGLFWITCRYEITDNGIICDFIEAQIIAILIGEGEPMISHKYAWEARVSGIERLGQRWNYYPRGRVELRRGKPVVFLNPHILESSEAVRLIIKEFELTNEISLKADNSWHYRCGADDETLL